MASVTVGAAAAEMERAFSSTDHLLPGFRFHPTDQELVRFFLRRKVFQQGHGGFIPDVDLYKFEPHQLPGMHGGDHLFQITHMIHSCNLTRPSLPFKLCFSPFWMTNLKTTNLSFLIHTYRSISRITLNQADYVRHAYISLQYYIYEYEILLA